jgi:hypothetical protein
MPDASIALLYVLSSGQWQMVMAITRVMQRKGWAHE